jgi:hypothetical protein
MVGYMANEKTWMAAPPQLFTADGGSVGQVTVADTAGFHVKALAILTSATLPSLNVQIKRVVSKTQMYVGTTNSPLQNHALDISAYTVADGASVSMAEQVKTSLRPDDIVQAAYENDPIVAWRTLSVDQYGNPYSAANTIPAIFDGTIAVGDVEVVGPTGNKLRPNVDGSINVNVVETPVAGNTVKSKYSSAYSVGSAILTTLGTYVVPPSRNATLQKISCSGSNYGDYTLRLNGTVMEIQRTWYGASPNIEFNFETGNANGLILQPGDTLLIQVIHRRPYTGDFDVRIQVLEITI